MARNFSILLAIFFVAPSAAFVPVGQSLARTRVRPRLSSLHAQSSSNGLPGSLSAAPPGNFVGLSEGEPFSYLEAVLKARVYDVCVETPCSPMSRLSDRVGNTVLVKREDMQPVFSFKLRGAYNLIANLPQSELDKGIVTASAGNHAQGVAFSAAHLGCKAIIVMPTVTPDIKVEAVRRLGADVRLIGDTFNEASEYAQSLSAEKGMPYIPPFDHPLVIAGQGTIGMEILRQVSSSVDLAAVFVPVGGGGLIAGIGGYLKVIRPGVRIIGVEPTGADAMFRSLHEGERVTLEQVDTFADGVAVKIVGKETFRVAQDVVDEVVLVTNDEICAALKDMFEDTRSVMEPSGALSIAGAKQWLAKTEMKGRTVIAVTSGANMNFDRLRVVAERADVGDKAEAMLATFIPEEKGSFLNFINILAGAGLSRNTPSRSITEFKYRFNAKDQARRGCATVFYSVNTASQEDSSELVKTLNGEGLETIDLSANDLSKDHVRFLAGGSADVADEEIYRIEFPEKAGALRSFLDALDSRFNISLFHYKSRGTITGFVLLGIQLRSAEDKASFEAVVSELGWMCNCETENVAAKLFL
eukprot:CAMPEP_0185772526 /NCGR_PEP_ID=MMETSP1174-20130828/69525_1 /TAXON_ID=35687 /ORGANISM="Dictyocha speculum, Strain CCMP1381" /LENGTH=584 /DNA_ID=CAMNT_0028458857 /DNA_START=136 /DNA_END=1890 /DNA_ORIENTATION=+